MKQQDYRTRTDAHMRDLKNWLFMIGIILGLLLSPFVVPALFHLIFP